VGGGGGNLLAGGVSSNLRLPWQLILTDRFFESFLCFPPFNFNFHCIFLYDFSVLLLILITFEQLWYFWKF